MRFKTTLSFWWCGHWAKNWVIMSLGQLNTVSTFSYGKIFHKTFFTKTQGCFLQYLCCPFSGAKSEASLALFFSCSQASQRLFDSTVSIFCWFLEKGGWSQSSRWLFPFPVNSPLSLSGLWLETSFCCLY